MIPVPIAAFFGKYGLALVGLALAFAATFYAGKLHERAAHNARATVAVEQSRVTERDGAGIANTAESTALATDKAQLEKAHEELEKLRQQLANVPRCPVPRAVVRLLDGGPRVPATAAAAGEPRAAAARVETAAGSIAESEPVECRAVIEHCAVNRLAVCEPNAQQLEGVQRFYNDLRKRFNTQP